MSLRGGDWELNNLQNSYWQTNHRGAANAFFHIHFRSHLWSIPSLCTLQRYISLVERWLLSNPVVLKTILYTTQWDSDLVNTARNTGLTLAGELTRIFLPATGHTGLLMVALSSFSPTILGHKPRSIWASGMRSPTLGQLLLRHSIRLGLGLTASNTFLSLKVLKTILLRAPMHLSK